MSEHNAGKVKVNRNMAKRDIHAQLCKNIHKEWQ